MSRHVRPLVIGAALAVTAASSAAIGAAASPGVSAVPEAAIAHHHVHGDLDGDGRRDLVVGAPGGDRVLVTYSHAKPGGSHRQWLTPPDSSDGPSFFGEALAVGDFNGDGFSDLAVGAPGWTNPVTVGNNSETQGALYVYRGSPTGLHYSGFAVYGPYDGDDPFELGGTLTSADINKDGFADLAMTVSGGGDHDVQVLYGRHTGLDTADEQFFDYFGVDALSFGDVNHNGYPDLVLGDTIDLNNPVDEFEGDVQVIYGHATGLSNTGRQKISGDEIGLIGGLGQSVAVGDINHDGYADVVVGDPVASDATHHNPGKIVLFFGGRHGISARRHQTFSEKARHLAAHTAQQDLFGWSVSVGLLSGDKYADVVVGAPGVRVRGHAGAGAVYVLRGTKHGVTVRHAQRFTAATHGVPGNPQSHASFGQVVHLSQLAGRYLDLLIGSPHASHRGFVAILRGNGHGIVAAHAKGVKDSAPGDLFGTSLAG